MHNQTPKLPKLPEPPVVAGRIQPLSEREQDDVWGGRSRVAQAWLPNGALIVGKLICTQPIVRD